MTSRALPYSLLVFAALIFAEQGIRGHLNRDPANCMYAAQRMVDGVPPYVSIFNHVGPLAPMLAAPVVAVARLFGADDLAMVRLWFGWLACFAAVGIYLVGRDTFESERCGLFAALVFIGITAAYPWIVFGPEKKIALLPLEVFALWFGARRQWFLGGAFGALAALVWQPIGVVLIAMFFQACTQDRPWEKIGVLAAGGACVLSAAWAYFAIHGATYAFLDGYLIFNLIHLDRNGLTVADHCHRALESLFRHQERGVVLVTGFLALVFAYARGRNQPAANSSVLFWSLLGLVGFSLMDFGRDTDLIPLFPYGAVGLGWLLAVGLETVEYHAARATRLPLKSSVTALVASLLAIGAYGNASRIESDRRLEREQHAAAEIERVLGEDGTIAVVGVPEILVKLRRANSNRYLFIGSGIHDHIAANVQDGLEGFVRDLRASAPVVVVVGRTHRAARIPLLRWLRREYSKETIGPWTFFVRRPNGEGPPPVTGVKLGAAA